MTEEVRRAAAESYVAVIPSLKPTEKLLLVLNGLKEVGFQQLLVVDDGSGQDYVGWFEEAAAIEGCTVLHHEVNRGKGAALRTAFAFVQDKMPWVKGIVTADADGQHLPEDILTCAARCLELGDGFCGTVLGSRDFSGRDVPWKSRTGNRITAAVFKLCCGIPIHDTQTGLRAFPASAFDLCLRVTGDRYEYETNVLLEMKRAGMEFEEVPITTVYEDNNKGSHYKPFRDSWRIYKLILKFIGSSLIASGTDYLVFYLAMHFLPESLMGSRILISTVIARAVSSFLNFNLNKTVVFSCKSDYRKTMLRYYALCIPQMLVSAGILTLLSHLLQHSAPIVVTLLKIPVDTILFLLSFQIQREWVFRQPKKR